jgi:type II secretory pathway component GspD/PulD (secretin)
VIYNDTTQKIVLIDTPSAVKAMSSVIQQMDVPLSTQTFQPQFIDVSELVEEVNAMLSETVGQMTVNDDSNTITVNDNVKILESIENRIMELDLMNKEFHIQTRIIQIILDDEHPLGVDWEAIVSDYQQAKFEHPFPLNQDGVLHFGSLTQEDYDVLIEALDTVGAVNTLSNLELNVINNFSSVLPVRTLPELVTSEELVTQDYEAGEELIRYHIRPIQRVDNIIQLEITPEFVLPGENPKFDQPVVMSLDVDSTVVVGGFFEPVILESTKKIPLLGDIPLLGFAFSRQKSRERKTEIITFFTPEVVSEESL